MPQPTTNRMPALSCRRVRTRESFRKFLRASGSHQTGVIRSSSGPPIVPSSSSSPRHKIRLHMLLALRSEAGQISPDELASLAEAFGWSLPMLARREGGLYALPAEVIEHLRKEATLEGRGHLLHVPYGQSNPLASLHPTRSKALSVALNAEALCGGTLPTFDFRCQQPRRPLPASLATLLRSQVACLITGSGTFEVGVAKWCRPEYLISQIMLPCHVLIAPAATKSFRYYVDLQRAPDRVPADYAFTPPVRSESMLMGQFFRASHEAAATECIYLQQSLLVPTPSGNGLGPAGPLGDEIMADLSQLNHHLIAGDIW